uniref:Uncharacterized protein n=1 Tax=Leersia perrieri TaxID=77586 RepID=A0A0D9VDU6_9ORYZ
MSRQAWKDEAAAQDLLKVDAARVHKVAAAQSRKDAVAPMRKAHGRAPVPLVPEQSSSGYELLHQGPSPTAAASSTAAP